MLRETILMLRVKCELAMCLNAASAQLPIRFVDQALVYNQSTVSF